MFHFLLVCVIFIGMLATWYCFWKRLWYIVTRRNIPGFHKLMTEFQMSLPVELISAGLVVAVTVMFLVSLSSVNADVISWGLVLGCVSPFVILLLSLAGRDLGRGDHEGPGWVVYTHHWTGRPTVQWINKGVSWRTNDFEWFVPAKKKLAIDEVENNIRIALEIEFEACPGLPLWQFGFLCAVAEGRIREAVVDLQLKGARFPKVVKRLSGIEIPPGIRGYLVGGRYHHAKVTHAQEYGDIRLPPSEASYTQMVIAPL